ncbi:hypothetical protein B0H19DRAFT_1383959 [Mycena capillaripes]|nr:hypothetical protein B0H19DRAFT_1383959 [Mycena capillaripes]
MVAPQSAAWARVSLALGRLSQALQAPHPDDGASGHATSRGAQVANTAARASPLMLGSAAVFDPPRRECAAQCHAAFGLQLPQFLECGSWTSLCMDLPFHTTGTLPTPCYRLYILPHPPLSGSPPLLGPPPPPSPLFSE